MSRATGEHGAPSPPEGRAWKPQVSGNSVSWNGSSVVKRYGANLDGYHRERALLGRLADHLPVPRPLPTSRPGSLHLPYVDGVNGQLLADADQPGRLLEELGTFLRNLHEIDSRTVADILPGDGPVIVHGDYAHYNALMSPDQSRLAAVLDWEVAHLGSRDTDIAWCEWQFRNRYPQHEWALRKLLDAYGDPPDPQARERALAARLEELRQ
jgi:aminoglycoside phosphotransferase (APT) family kinase protein